jgi:FkbM family methyltransferase
MISVFETLLLLYARRAPFRAGKYRLVERCWRSCIRGGTSMRIATLKYGNFTMECDLRRMLQRQFYFFGTYFLEEPVLKAWSRFSSEASLVLDVGANAGIFSLAAASANSEASIHAFEPTPTIASHLRETIARNSLNGRVHVHECAVSKKSGSACLNFFSGETMDNEGMNYLTSERRRPDSIEVPTISIDEFCGQRALTSVDLLKVDVQGNEPDVLEGAAGLLSQGVPRTIFLELNWGTSCEDCPATCVVERLEAAGYSFADAKHQDKYFASGTWMRSLSDVIATRL